MRLFAILSAVVSCVAAVSPSYPGQTASIATRVNDIVRAARASSSDDALMQAKLSSEAKARFQQEADAESRIEALRKDAFTLVHANLLKVLHAGGCPRDYSGCPRGWSASGDVCSPSLDYAGSCGTTRMAGYSAQQKESFAVSCEASWPCQDSKGTKVPEWMQGFSSYGAL